MRAPTRLTACSMTRGKRDSCCSGLWTRSLARGIRHLSELWGTLFCFFACDLVSYIFFCFKRRPCASSDELAFHISSLLESERADADSLTELTSLESAALSSLQEARHSWATAAAYPRPSAPVASSAPSAPADAHRATPIDKPHPTRRKTSTAKAILLHYMSLFEPDFHLPADFRQFSDDIVADLIQIRERRLQLFNATSLQWHACLLRIKVRYIIRVLYLAFLAIAWHT